MSDYTSIIGVEVSTKWGDAVIISVLEISEGVFMFLARADKWECWIDENDLVEG